MLKPVIWSSCIQPSSSNNRASISTKPTPSLVLLSTNKSRIKKRSSRRDRSWSSSSSSPSSSWSSPPSSSSSTTSTLSVPIPIAKHSSSASKSTTNTTAPTLADSTTMSKLSEPLKALISAPHARPGYTRAPSNIKSIFKHIASDAKSKSVGLPAWVTISTAASMTLNCPEAMTQLFDLTRELEPSHADAKHAVVTAELMREVGLKCISFNGIPRSINCLGAFHNGLPSDVKALLSTTPTRGFTPTNIEARLKDGYGLWDSVYFGFERKLLDKLAQSHPDLPVHIINSHYSGVLSDPAGVRVSGAKVGRVLTSLVAITCLRGQTGVGPQVTSHVFGLRKAYERGDASAEGEEPVEGGEWLASEEGNRWILESIDGIVKAVTGGEGTTFAPGLRPKL